MEIVRMLVKMAEGEEKFTDAFFGYDVGREVHASELILLNFTGGRLRTRVYLTLRKCRIQEISLQISRLKVSSWLI